MQERINHLESLVTVMMNQSNAKPGFEPTTDEAALNGTQNQLLNSFGRISLENSEIGYVDSTHWTAILDGIADLKDHFDDAADSPESINSTAHEPDSGLTMSLLGWVRPVTRAEILVAVPPRPVSDRLVACYFNSANAASGKPAPMNP